MQSKKPPQVSNGLVVIIVAIAAAVIVAAVAVVAVVVLNNRDEDTPPPVSSQLSLGYATEAKVMTDQNELQAAMDQATENAKNGNIALKYKNNAYSSDGINFQCYIANSSSNVYDMFLTIYADAELTDQIFLSELVPPGSGFENITLERELGIGDNTVYVALTQVDTNEDGEQVILRQVVHTMQFHVGKIPS